MIPLADTILIGTLYTTPLQDHDNASIGNFTLDVRVTRGLFDGTNDKQGFARRTISMFLASAVLDTQVPVEYWHCSIEPGMARKLNLPATMSFGGMK